MLQDERRQSVGLAPTIGGSSSTFRTARVALRKSSAARTDRRSDLDVSALLRLSDPLTLLPLLSYVGLLGCLSIAAWLSALEPARLLLGDRLWLFCRE